MLTLLLKIFVIILCVVIAVQDFRSRSISWKTLPLFTLAFILLALQQRSTIVILKNAGLNLLFLFAQYNTLTLVSSIKEKRIVNLTRAQLGWGDVLFILTTIFAFSPYNFIVFNIVAILFSILGVMLYKVMTDISIPYIPFAGLIAVFLIICIIFSHIVGFNFYNDNLMVNLFD